MGLLDQQSYAGYANEGQRLAVEPMSFTPMEAARFVAEATPIIGDAMAAKEIYDELQKDNPNYKSGNYEIWGYYTYNNKPTFGYTCYNKGD